MLCHRHAVEDLTVEQEAVRHFHSLIKGEDVLPHLSEFCLVLDPGFLGSFESLGSGGPHLLKELLERNERRFVGRLAEGRSKATENLLAGLPA